MNDLNSLWTNSTLYEGYYSVRTTELNAGWQIRVDGPNNSAAIPLLLCENEIEKLRGILGRLNPCDKEPFKYWCNVVAGAARVSMKESMHS